jgi:hypothetical protein
LKLITLFAFAAAALLPAAALAQEGGGQDRANAARACKTLQSTMPAGTFALTFGTNANRSNAFGNCVSRMARTGQESRQSARAACAAERDDANFAAAHGGKTFAQHYGTGRTLANAFGRCVSGKAGQASTQARQDVQNAARRCAAERRTLGAAGFATRYGGTPNAFGRCVSGKLAATTG